MLVPGEKKKKKSTEKYLLIESSRERLFLFLNLRSSFLLQGSEDRWANCDKTTSSNCPKLFLRFGKLGFSCTQSQSQKHPLPGSRTGWGMMVKVWVEDVQDLSWGPSVLALFSCERTMGLDLLCTKFALPLSGNNKNNLRTGFMAIIKATLKLALNDHGQMSLDKNGNWT